MALTEAHQRVQALSRLVLRKLRRIDYIHMPLVPGYAETEEAYRQLRGTLALTDSMIRSIENYEHGSSFYKSLKRGFQYINDQAALGLYRSADMYESAATIGTSLKQLHDNPAQGAVGERFENVFLSLSKSKQCLNTRLEQLRGRLKALRAHSEKIDALRAEVRELRFDAEVVAQSDRATESERQNKKNAYTERARAAHAAMKEFLEDKGLVGVLSGVAQEYRKHMEESADLLRHME